MGIVSKDKEIPIAFVRECFELLPGGKVRWRERPLRHFASEQYWKAANKKFAGRDACTSVNGRNYLRCSVRVNGHQYNIRAHRLVYALFYGRWPKNIVDHIDGDTLNNDPTNLRDVTPSENLRNMVMNTRNTSGHTGVRFLEAKNVWIAQIGIGDSKEKILGQFYTRDEAIAARRGAEAVLGYTGRGHEAET